MSTRSDRPLPATGERLDGTPRSGVLDVAFERRPQRVLARLRGEIDLDDVARLRSDLVVALRSSPCGLDVDLSDVTFCDSQGLHLLTDLDRLARQSGKTLVLTGLSRPVTRLLEVTGARRALTVRGRPEPEAGQGDALPAR
ncbi:STAS domain-containing protein [Streptomyces sp. NPDC014779]|uniref:STAS domain-containing protein n=1 Tax=Streptomyces sp. NPDC014779 TaxID=3364911 RepID=UPI003701498C